MIDDRRDLLIRAALAPRPNLAAPAELAEAIQAAVRTTPQRRSRFGWILLPPSQLRLVLVLGALLIALLVAIAVGSRPPTPPTGILGYHGPPERTGVMPGPGPGESPIALWTKSVGGSVDVLGMPLVSSGLVYAEDGGGGVTAFAEGSGTLNWSVRPDGVGTGTIVIVGKTLLHGSSHGQVSALDAVSGAKLWSVDVGERGTLSMASDGAVLVVASTDGRVYGLDPVSGATRWKLDAGGPVERGAAISDGIGYVGSASGRVTAFRLADGGVVWFRELGFGEIVTPAVDRGLVFVAHGFGDGSIPAILYALDVRDGSVRWKWPEPTVSRLFVGAVEGSTVYALNEDAHAFAIDVTTGAAQPFAQAGGKYGSLAAIVGPTIYLTSADGQVAAIDRASRVARWRIAVKGVPSTPAVLDGRVFVATDLGKVVAIGDPGASAKP
jgi:outer membrane protein assembly factor BamB